MSILEHVNNAVPAPLQACLNWTAALTGLASILTTWVPIVVGIMSGTWMACQLWLFFKNQPWKKQ